MYDTVEWMISKSKAPTVEVKEKLIVKYLKLNAYRAHSDILYFGQSFQITI